MTRTSALKGLLVLVLLVALCIPFTGCGNEEEGGTVQGYVVTPGAGPRQVLPPLYFSSTEPFAGGGFTGVEGALVTLEAASSSRGQTHSLANGFFSVRGPVGAGRRLRATLTGYTDADTLIAVILGTKWAPDTHSGLGG